MRHWMGGAGLSIDPLPSLWVRCLAWRTVDRVFGINCGELDGSIVDRQTERAFVL